MRTLVVGALAAMSLIAGQPGQPAHTAEPAAIEPCPGGQAGSGDWTQVGGDEFDDGVVNTDDWGLYDGPGTGGVGTRSPEAISEAGGELRITGTGTDPTGETNVSGGMAHLVRPYTYGRWEVRMRADLGNGYGQALLLWPDSEVWPEDGELDFVEIPKGERERSFYTVHYGSDNSQYNCSVDGDFSTWHTYLLEWERDHITFFLDGEPVYTVTDPAAIPTKPMHLAIQQDMGPWANWIPAPDENTPEEVVMHVDWVRIYAR